MPRPTDPVETSRPEPGTLAEVTVCHHETMCVNTTAIFCYRVHQCAFVARWKVSLLCLLFSQFEPTS